MEVRNGSVRSNCGLTIVKLRHVSSLPIGTPMPSETHKLSLREKLAYGLGDSAANLIGASQATFLLFFYTDVLGISAKAAGAILLWSRVVDALKRPDCRSAGRSHDDALGALPALDFGDVCSAGGGARALLHDAEPRAYRKAHVGDPDVQPVDDHVRGEQHSLLRALRRHDERHQRAYQSGLVAVSLRDGCDAVREHVHC